MTIIMTLCVGQASQAALPSPHRAAFGDLELHWGFRASTGLNALDAKGC